MAEKMLNTRIALKIDTLENWLKSDLPLKKGELALATVAASAGTALEEPVVMMKVGEDGVKTFKDLEWNMYAKASDVLAAAKTETGLTAFINNVIANSGLATDGAMTALTNRVTTAEGKITTLEGKMTAVEGKAAANETAISALQGLVGEDSVTDQIAAEIAKLNLGGTYELKGEAAKVQTALDTYKNTNDAAVLENKNAAAANTAAITAIKDGTTIDSFADVETALAGKEAAGAAAKALTDANAYADGLAKNYDAKGAAATAESNAKTYAKEYADSLAGNYDAAGAADTALTNAKKYTDDEIKEWVGDSNVGDQIAALSTVYDAKGAAAAAQAAAKTYTDGLNTAMNTRVEALEAIDHEHANKAELDKIVEGDKAKWDAMEQNAKDYADGLDGEMDTRVKALEAKFGTGEGNVESQIDAAVAAEKTLREAADTAIGNRIQAIENDYLKQADKTALQDQIDDNADEIEAMKLLVGDESVEDAIAKEAAIARAAEKANADAIEAIEKDYLKAADKTELQNQITSNDTDITNLQTAVGTKAAQADLEALTGRVTTAEGKVTTLEGEMDAAQEAIADLNELVGDTKVSEYVAGELKTLKDGQLTTMQGEIDAVEGRATVLEGKAHEHGNKSVLDGIEAADITAWDAKVDGVTAAADSGLKATRTGNTVAIEIDDTITWVFDCGDSTTV